MTHTSNIEPCKSGGQASDIYTKWFTDPREWQDLLVLNGTVDPKYCWDDKKPMDYFRRMLRKCDIDGEQMPFQMTTKAKTAASMADALKEMKSGLKETPSAGITSAAPSLIPLDKALTN